MKKNNRKKQQKTKEATKFYYHKMSFTALSHMLFKLAPRLLQKLERMEKRTPWFDKAAALCPLLSISNRVFRHCYLKGGVRWSIVFVAVELGKCILFVSSWFEKDSQTEIRTKQNMIITTRSLCFAFCVSSH